MGPDGAALETDFDRLPVPDFGLGCPNCNYPLAGLPSHRCPECGTAFDVRELIEPWTRLREPSFSGQERPIPAWGLRCGACGAALEGATDHHCPECCADCSAQLAAPRKAWFEPDATLSKRLTVPGVMQLLAEHQIPYIPVQNTTFLEIHLGGGPIGGRLNVASEFYYDFLYAVDGALLEITRAADVVDAVWGCATCGESVPGNFEVCWNCDEPRP